MFALVDCNNFFVSCERVFNPKLVGKPVVVLSSNDGCIVARSNEAKALGIPMGAPAFEYRSLFEAKEVIALSSNFTLYSDMSSRIMRSLEFFSSDIEIYSIDEAFLRISNPSREKLKQMRQKILQWTGIPVSIGVAPTKTLAKIANHKGKKNPDYEGVFCLPSEPDTILESVPTREVWGIGPRYSEFLMRNDIATAKDLRDAEDRWIKKHLSVVGLRTVWELRGTSCLSLEELPSKKKSIATTRTFGRMIKDLQELQEAISTYTAKGAEKVRDQESLVSFMSVFVAKNPFPSEYVQAQIALPEPTDDSMQLIAYAKAALDKIYENGCVYRKAGVIFSGLVSNNSCQRNFFHNPPGDQERRRRLMQTLDKMNQTHGKRIISFAAEGIKKTWSVKRERLTPSFTSKWDEILTIRI